MTMRIKHQWLVILSLLLLATVVTTAIISQYRHNKVLEKKIEKQIQELHEVQSSKIKTQQQVIDTLNSQIKVKSEENTDLHNQLQSKRSATQQLAQTARTILGVQTTSSAATPTPQNGSDAFYKSYIYSHESGNRTTAVNSLGCRGLGQACPGSKLPCGDDYACQDAWFSNYAISRYGSWAGAYQFWIGHHWW